MRTAQPIRTQLNTPMKVHDPPTSATVSASRSQNVRSSVSRTGLTPDGASLDHQINDASLDRGEVGVRRAEQALGKLVLTNLEGHIGPSSNAGERARVGANGCV